MCRRDGDTIGAMPLLWESVERVVGFMRHITGVSASLQGHE